LLFLLSKAINLFSYKKGETIETKDFKPYINKLNKERKNE